MSRVIEWNPLLSSFAGLTGESRRLLDSPVKPASDEGTGSGQAGFTLIEMIVALAVLSLGLVALLNVTGENVRAAGTIRETVVGQIVAENHLVEAMLAEDALEAGTTTGEEGMAGRRWTWRRTVSPTANAGMQRIEVSVHPAEDADDGRVDATLTAFRGVDK